jgi:aspartyl-tRNA synthetase
MSAAEAKAAAPKGGKGATKSKKAKKKKLSKAERMALREAQQDAARAAQRPMLDHPDDGDFGDLALNQSSFKTDREWTEIDSLSADKAGSVVWVRGRVNSVRNKGGVVFITLRRGFANVQAMISKNDAVSGAMVKYSGQLKPESIIDVKAVVSPVKEPIESTTQSDVELVVQRIYTIADVYATELPFQLDDASHSEADYERDPSLIRVADKIRLDNRWVDLRTTANHAIFRIQSGIGQLFREYLYSEGFLEIHSPKLIGGASEGGANVFHLQYFGRDACLAQSPQLYKQMAVCGDMRRVFEVGPVFRAEDSNTHRHLCEFTGLDLEMEFNEHYHEVLAVIGKLFKYIFRGLETRYAAELEAVRRQYPFEDLLVADELLILTFAEAMKMIEDEHAKMVREGRTEEADSLLMGESKDFSTPQEKLLGKLVHEKYATDFYCVDKYPVSARPFYTMPDPYNPEVSNSYDFFIRGEEITSGAQRVHDPDLLVAQAKESDIEIETIQGYVDSFKTGSSPHGGCGIGLERVVFLSLGLDNVRKTSMFPRDPKRCTP